MTLRKVETVLQRGDNTILVYVQTDSFKPGQEVEVSVYLTQGETYAAHYEKKFIPFPDPSNPKQPVVLHVELPATPLNADQQVTVLTRVAEVWPSVLENDPPKLGAIIGGNVDPDQAPKAVWTYKESEGKGSGDQGSPTSANEGSQVMTVAQEQPTA
jgi:hypothetical protein